MYTGPHACASVSTACVISPNAPNMNKRKETAWQHTQLMHTGARPLCITEWWWPFRAGHVTPGNPHPPGATRLGNQAAVCHLDAYKTSGRKGSREKQKKEDKTHYDILAEIVLTSTALHF